MLEGFAISNLYNFIIDVSLNPKMSEIAKDNIPTTHKEVVFAAMSKKSFFLREYIVKYILDNNYAPSCAFMMFSYFLLDTTNRSGLINATNALIIKSDQLWVFGPISDGVVCEICLATSLRIPVKYFDIVLKDVVDFVEISESKVKFEDKKAKFKFLEI